MIGITYASVVGGQAIPSGSAMNVMAMNVLAAHTGVSVSFLGWTAICLPIALVLLVFCWASVVLVFKPEPIAEETRAAHRAAGPRGGPAGGAGLEGHRHRGVHVRRCGWPATGPGGTSTAIAVLCLALFFVPGIDVLTWRGVRRPACRGTSCCSSAACRPSPAASSEQGAASWLFGSTVGTMAVSGGTVVAAATAGLLPLLRLDMPRGPRVHRHLPHPAGGHGRGAGREPRGVRRDRGRERVDDVPHGRGRQQHAVATGTGTGTWWTSSGRASSPRWPWWPCTPRCSCPLVALAGY